MVAAMLVFLDDLTPTLAGAWNDHANFALQIFDRYRRLAPIPNFAVGPGSNDRMERNYGEPVLALFERREYVLLVPAYRRVEPGAIRQEIAIIKPDCKRGG